MLNVKYFSGMYFIEPNNFVNISNPPTMYIILMFIFLHYVSLYTMYPIIGCPKLSKVDRIIKTEFNTKVLMFSDLNILSAYLLTLNVVKT